MVIYGLIWLAAKGALSGLYLKRFFLHLSTSQLQVRMYSIPNCKGDAHYVRKCCKILTFCEKWEVHLFM